jgi:undecaprenyl-diphosphatase
LEYLEFFLYGLIQGFTEFIPVSSTAHLKVISEFLGINDPGSSLSAIIQLGSVFALIWHFKNDIFKLKNKSSSRVFDCFLNSKLFKSIYIGTIPIVLLGFSIKIFIPNFFNNFLRSNLSIALISFIMAIFMYVAECSKKGSINLSNHIYTDSLLIGFSQAFAIFPGVSRSGVTISTALISGWERGDAAKYSFLLGIPSISLAAIVEFISSLNEFSSFGFLPLIVGITTTFLSSLLAINFLLKYYSSNGLKLFIVYRVIFGIVILLKL